MCWENGLHGPKTAVGDPSSIRLGSLSWCFWLMRRRICEQRSIVAAAAAAVVMVLRRCREVVVGVKAMEELVEG